MYEVSQHFLFSKKRKKEHHNKQTQLKLLQALPNQAWQSDRNFLADHVSPVGSFRLDALLLLFRMALQPRFWSMCTPTHRTSARPRESSRELLVGRHYCIEFKKKSQAFQEIQFYTSFIVIIEMSENY